MEPMLPNPEVPQPVSKELSNEETISGGAEVAQFGGETVKNLSTQQTSGVKPQNLTNQPVKQHTNVAVTTTPITDDDVPAIADDVDVIEKEWVDKARKIVNSTKDNPHQQEKEVSKLQADYLMKRYGKQIKLTE
jgi:hypothetical protein